MSSLLRLPTDLVCPIVSQWLPIRDVSFLDSAYCTTQERPSWLISILRSPSCRVRLVSYVFNCFYLLKWLIVREVRASELFLYISNEKEWINYITNFGKSVTSIRLIHFDMSSEMCEQLLNAILLHCSNLTSMVCVRCRVNESILPFLCGCTKLEEFKLLRCLDVFGSDFKMPSSISALHVKDVALDVLWSSLAALNQLHDCIMPNVHRLHVRCQDYKNSVYVRDVELPSITTMLQRCGRTLRYLGFKPPFRHHNNISVRDAINLCPNILHLNVSMYNELTDEDVNIAASHLTQLRTINISGCRITDASLIALAARRQGTLEGLFAGQCVNVTGIGFNATLTSCFRLRTLGLELLPQVSYSLDLQLLDKICTLQTAWRINNEISALLSWFSRLENLYLYIGNFSNCVQLDVLPEVLAGVDLPALRKLILNAPSSFSYESGFGDDIHFSCGKRACLTVPEQNTLVAALHVHRPDLHIRFEFGDDWPSNLMKLPV